MAYEEGRIDNGGSGNANSRHAWSKTKPMAVVVNDDLTCLTMLSGLLSLEGLAVQEYKSANEALNAFSHGDPPDLIITDLYMPGLDGWRFCSLLRSPDYLRYNRVPIIVISATFSGEEVSRICLELGADAFLPSPVDTPNFIRTMRALLRNERTRISPRALIVGRDTDKTLESVTRAFETHGYQVSRAFTGKDALAQADLGVFHDVTILDSHLLDTSVEVLLAELKKRHSQSAYVMTTEDPRPELAMEWIKLGADAYVKKPYDPEYLIHLSERVRRQSVLLRMEDLLAHRTLQLRESEERYGVLVESISELICKWRIDTTLTFVNAAFCRYFGKTREALLGSRLPELVSDIDREAFSEAAAQVAAHPQVQKGEFRFSGAAGADRWLQWTDNPLTQSDGLISEYLSVGTDITERKKTEVLLRRKAEERRLLIDTIPVQIWYLEDTDTYGAVNLAHAEFLGSTPKAVAHQRIDSISIQNAGGVFREGNETVFRSGKPYHSKAWVPNAGGEARCIEFVKTPCLNSDGKVSFVVCTGVDITETVRAEADRLDMERRILMSQKRESLGTMAGAIAHHFNNLLAVVMGNLEFAMLDLPPMTEPVKHLTEAMSATKRAADLILMMLTYLGDDFRNREPCDLAKAVNQSIPMIEAAMPAHIRLEVSIADHLPMTFATYEALRQIILTLAMNAWESMEEAGGIVRIIAGKTNCDKEYLKQVIGTTFPEPGDYLFLEVTDNGCGMDSDTVARMFDPFFSTKFTGRGLGLAMVFGMVRSYKGGIVVRSAPGKGTSIKLLLSIAGLSP
jgi:two-component system, cell cycle sensor histidine kinase and response regulator CckA